MKSTDRFGDMPDDVATLWYLVRHVAAVLDRQSDRLLRGELNTSLAQFLVLSVVDAHPGALSQQAIADRLGLTKGTVSRQVDQAVASGLMTVRRAPQTRRENIVALTDAGTSLVRAGDALTEQGRHTLRDAIDPADLAIVISSLRRLLETLER